MEYKIGDIVIFKSKHMMYENTKFIVTDVFDDSIKINIDSDIKWSNSYFELDRSYIRKMKIENIKNGI